MTHRQLYELVGTFRAVCDGQTEPNACDDARFHLSGHVKSGQQEQPMPKRKPRPVTCHEDTGSRGIALLLL